MTGHPLRGISYEESPRSPPPAGLLSTRLDPLIKRVFHCAEPRLVPAVRQIDPSSAILTDWSAFAAAYPQADVSLVLRSAPDGDDLAARLDALARKHCLPSVIVVTHLDAEHLLPFRRTPVDEFVPLGSMATDLPLAVLRSVIDSRREHLALHLEGLEHCGRDLRFGLARVLRQPTRIKTIGQMATALAVTPRTLENQWKALSGGADGMRLTDLLWMIRLLEALEHRAKATPLGDICQDLKVDLRTLQRACRRHVGSSLGRVSGAGAIAELLRLRRRILKLLRVEARRR